MEGYTNSKEEILDAYEISEHGVNEVIDVEHY